MKREEHYKRIDKVERGSEMIYKNQLNYTLNFGKFFTITSLAGMTALCAANLVLNKDQLAEEYGMFGEFALEASDIFPLLLGFYVFNVVLLKCVNLLPLRIYRHNDNYVAILPGILPMMNTQLPFKKGELVENFNSRFTVGEVSYKIRDHHVIIFSNRFRRPSDLYSMLSDSQSSQYLKK